MNTFEAICPITIAATVAGGNAQFTPRAGHVIGCVIIAKGGDNPGMVRASIRNQAGEAISESQAIENYRSREAGYFEGYKPLNFMADGTQHYLTITASEAMVTPFHADLIYIYAKQSNSCAVPVNN